MAVPRAATVGMKSSTSQSVSAATSAPLRSPMRAWKMSGYCVAEWLPQMLTLLMSRTGAPVCAASCAMALLWSRRVSAVNRSAGTSGALAAATAALVFAGLPTTMTRMSSAATSLMTAPCSAKMAEFADSRSARSMPLERGFAPMRSPKSVPSNAARASSKMSTEVSSGNAPSCTSIAVPCAAETAWGSSRRRSLIGRSGPSMSPAAMRNTAAYPMLPAAPVTVTTTGVVSVIFGFLSRCG